MDRRMSKLPPPTHRHYGRISRKIDHPEDEYPIFQNFTIT